MVDLAEPFWYVSELVVWPLGWVLASREVNWCALGRSGVESERTDFRVLRGFRPGVST